MLAALAQLSCGATRLGRPGTPVVWRPGRDSNTGLTRTAYGRKAAAHSYIPVMLHVGRSHIVEVLAGALLLFSLLTCVWQLDRHSRGLSIERPWLAAAMAALIIYHFSPYS